jgi:hypothetical protein
MAMPHKITAWVLVLDVMIIVVIMNENNDDRCHE